MESEHIQLPTLTTQETKRLRSDYPSIEHLEAGNVAAWLVERQEQLLVRARDERTGMNLAKLITFGAAATGAICYATSPLALIGAIIAGVGYVWAVAQDLNDSHQFAPIPFVRGNFIEFLSAMGDKDAREEWFATSNEIVDLMFHLDPFDRYEFGMLKEHAHVLSEYLVRVEPGKRFYAYRWLFDWFVNLKGSFPGQEQFNSHLATVTLDPRVNYQQVSAIQEHQAQMAAPQGIPETNFADLPETKFADLPNARIGVNTKLEAIETQVVEESKPELAVEPPTEPSDNNNVMEPKTHPDNPIADTTPETVVQPQPEASQEAARPSSHPVIDTNSDKYIELYQWSDLPKEATGIAVLGDPGSGKSCGTEAILGIATQELGEAQIIVFDTHWKPGKYEGLYVIYEPEKIFQAMRWILETELQQRKNDRFSDTEPTLFIWVAEELGDLFLEAKRLANKLEDDKEAKALRELVPDFLVGCGSQGRKYEFLGFIVNQASNSKANGMAGLGDYLEAYIKVLMGRVATKQARLMGMDKKEREWLSQQAYPTTVDGQPAIHLTHGQYKIRQKKQAPAPYQRAKSLPLPLELIKLCDVLPNTPPKKPPVLPNQTEKQPPNQSAGVESSKDLWEKAIERLEQAWEFSPKEKMPPQSEVGKKLLEIIKSATKYPISFEAIRKSRKWEDNSPDKATLLKGLQELSEEWIRGDEEKGYYLQD